MLALYTYSEATLDKKVSNLKAAVEEQRKKYLY